MDDDRDATCRAITARPTRPGDTYANTYFGVRIESAVDLMEAREYEGLERTERLRKALSEQHGFLNSLLSTSLNAAFDLRIVVRPERPVPLESGHRGPDLGRRMTRRPRDRPSRWPARSSPDCRVTWWGAELDDQELAGLFDPVRRRGPGLPRSSPSARSPACHRGPTPRFPYYFSIVPFNWVENDWTSVYAGLAASSERRRAVGRTAPDRAAARAHPAAARSHDLLRAVGPGGRDQGRSLLRRTADPSGRVRGRGGTGLPGPGAALRPTGVRRCASSWPRRVRWRRGSPRRWLRPSRRSRSGRTTT